ncbi:alpha/beta hydrolase [Dyadobacter sp. CY345]|uniref:alpha/beta hydrolase n=1 Tax=Dyadobacter sp. CY345 TaxID=2909335 RepID=UPI001F407C04|nr:alpha/beta hydrolase [Dyadobacter sp. CY345]MCF2446662.1 alpha/beta hydrolase [Dyadobacter sp. CY345]
MKAKFLSTQINCGLITVMALFGIMLTATVKIQAQNVQAKNVVIVHGAFADGSSWRGVYDILSKKGYNITLVQNPCSSLKDDVNATNLALDKQDGPVVLVGHSWGGTVITQAGVHPKVVSLVYLSGFQPDKGENTIKWASSLPAAPENGLMAPDEKGYVYYSKEKFHDGFAADLDKKDTDFMYAAQGFIFGECFATPVTEAAWKTKPSFGVLPTDDKSINPEILRNMYTRSGSKITELKSSHVSYISHPDIISDVIITASKNISSKPN